jgi:hypothetical protein
MYRIVRTAILMVLAASVLPLIARPWPSRAAAQVILSCPGDCNGDFEVSIDELITGVSIALGHVETSACLAADANVDGTCDQLEVHPNPRSDGQLT